MKDKNEQLEEFKESYNDKKNRNIRQIILEKNIIKTSVLDLVAPNEFYKNFDGPSRLKLAIFK